MVTANDRESLRQTFELVAGSYQQSRPEYPPELFDDLVEHAHLSPGAHLLEVGCATGKATLPLARRGFRVTCIEPGAALAEQARGNLAGLDVEIVNAYFEDWAPAPPVTFDLVFAATAWHWVDPATRYERAWAALRPGGHLAIWGAAHVFADNGDPFFKEIQAVYDEINEGKPAGEGWPRPGELQDSRDDIEASGLFDLNYIKHFDWETVYDAEGYIELLRTFSGHIAMEPWQTDRLYGEIRRRLAARPDGLVRRHWGAVLHVAAGGSAKIRAPGRDFRPTGEPGLDVRGPAAALSGVSHHRNR